MRKGRIKKQVFFYLIIIAVLFYVFFRFGITFLVNTAFYISSGFQTKKSGTAPQLKKGIGIVIDPILVGLPDATNSASIIVEGRANTEAKVEVYLNGSYQEKTTADYDGAFEMVVELEEGENEIYVKSPDPYSNKQLSSQVYSVTYLKKMPTLELSGVEDGKRYYDKELTLNGTTDKEVFVKANGSPVVVRADGTFSYQLRLNKGENRIMVEAEDVAGNITKKELTVTYVE